MDDPEIRRRRDDDLKACVEALATVHEADRYPARWPDDPAGWLTPEGLLGAWAAWDGTHVLGHVALTRTDYAMAAQVGLPPDELTSVSRLFAASSARRSGVATALLATAVAAATADDLRPVLEVEVGGTAAVRLYERAGWRLVSSREGDWTTADGRTALLHTYLAPAGGAR
ncbi:MULTISPECIES: GNAT family N-acetyltransferase [unclassified Streptomyces]|uniref:GNAT family N-acetyltransferase n=1 Tax=unclassified Streptomyces TaxID=2593676 RepID=UPI002E294ECB|nr:GNAT family N-acetyltransferase [Streptomyces sp. NBC_00342]